jgi:hypothetical protein
MAKKQSVNKKEVAKLSNNRLMAYDMVPDIVTRYNYNVRRKEDRKRKTRNRK